MAKSIAEYFVGQSAGYGGGAMAGGPTAPVNWAGTPSGPQTSRRLQSYPASRRYTYMQGNTVIGSSLYDTITDDDLKDPSGKFGPDEILAGLRYEMKRMEYPSKDVAKETVIKNLTKNPKYYSSLDMYFNSDKEGTIMENIDPKELEMGISIEHEHTDDDALARKIAMDHLSEDPHYYSKLQRAGLEHGDSEDVPDEDMGDDMEHDAEDMEDDMGDEVAPTSVTIIAVGGVDNAQPKLSSSNLGSGNPIPLKSTNLEAPENKLVGPNKIATTKTPQMLGQTPIANVDPLNHFGCQLAEVWKKSIFTKINEEMSPEEVSKSDMEHVKQIVDRCKRLALHYNKLSADDKKENRAEMDSIKDDVRTMGEYMQTFLNKSKDGEKTNFVMYMYKLILTDMINKNQSHWEKEINTIIRDAVIDGKVSKHVNLFSL